MACPTWLDCLPDELQDIIRVEYIKSLLADVHGEMLKATVPRKNGGIPVKNAPVISRLLAHFPEMIYENVESYYLILDWFVDEEIVPQARIDRMVCCSGFPMQRERSTELEDKCDEIAFLILNRPLCRINKTFYASLLARLNHQELLCFKRYVESRCNLA